ncbi:hypothetical protein TWF481_010214 [Arthrobotrys musiformis]|uniref:DNA2/NAM7 helicase helicase domain-containing protein n=1 Tax=Arthrobotrys musiformis TaxID=47236 RepID=A0AAV9W627_9PEZI
MVEKGKTYSAEDGAEGKKGEIEEDKGDEGSEDGDGGVSELSYPYKVSPPARMYQLDRLWIQQVQSFGFGRMNTQELAVFHTQRDQLRAEVMRMAKIVFGTRLGLGDRSIRAASPKIAIIDEAGQASEIETVTPIVIPTIHQVLLFGDHQQLPTISTFETMIYTRSLLERLANVKTQQPNRPSANFHLLVENYHSVPQILALQVRRQTPTKSVTRGNTRDVNNYPKAYHVGLDNGR